MWRLIYFKKYIHWSNCLQIISIVILEEKQLDRKTQTILRSVGNFHTCGTQFMLVWSEQHKNDTRRCWTSAKRCWPWDKTPSCYEAARQAWETQQSASDQQTELREENLSVELCQKRFLIAHFSRISHVIWTQKDQGWHFICCWWCIAPCNRLSLRIGTTKQVGPDMDSSWEWKWWLSFSAVFPRIRFCCGGAAEADQRHCSGAELAERAAGSADRFVHSSKWSISCKV